MSIKIFNVTECLKDCPFCSESAYCNFYNAGIWDDMGDKNKPTFCKIVKVEAEEQI